MRLFHGEKITEVSLSEPQERVLEALGHGAQLIWNATNTWILEWDDGEVESVSPVTARWLIKHKYIREISSTYGLED